MPLKGKYALVTGGSRGIGRGIALKLGAEGMKVGNVVALLCAEEADWITGQVIVADGGASLMNPEVPPELQLN